MPLASPILHEALVMAPNFEKIACEPKIDKLNSESIFPGGIEAVPDCFSDSSASNSEKIAGEPEWTRWFSTLQSLLARR